MVIECVIDVLTDDSMSNGERNAEKAPTANQWLDCFVACINRLGWEWAPVCAWLCSKEFPDAFRETRLPPPSPPLLPGGQTTGIRPLAAPSPPSAAKIRIQGDIIEELEEANKHKDAAIAARKLAALIGVGTPDAADKLREADTEEKKAHDIELEVKGKKKALALID